MTVSIRDVATLAGVSVGTVSNVLNRPDTVSAASAQRVQNAIEELGYVRNDAARQLRAGVSTTVGFVALDGRNPFFADVVGGAENEATTRGLALLHGNSDEDTARETLYIDLFEQQMVRGLLIAPFGDVTTRLTRLRARGIPSVLIDRFSGDGLFSSVSVDSVAGGRLAAEHLLERGRRRIAFVGGPFDIRQVTDRLAGARSAVENSGLDAVLEVVPTHALTVEEGVEAGRRLLTRDRTDRPDAVFAANDLLALGLLQGLVVWPHARPGRDRCRRFRRHPVRRGGGRAPHLGASTERTHRGHRHADPARRGRRPRPRDAPDGVRTRTGGPGLDRLAVANRHPGGVTRRGCLAVRRSTGSLARSHQEERHALTRSRHPA